MIHLPGHPMRLCGGVVRRDVLRAGALGLAGLSLPGLFRLQATQAAAGRPAAEGCIVIFCWGAPSQFETFDPKPDAPSAIRGEFGTLQTSLPGVLFSEHIPLLAQRANRMAIVRTCRQTSTHHQSAGYEALTGFPPIRDAVALTATPADHPNFGSVVARMAPGQTDVPPFVSLPQLISDVGNLTPGQFAGYLGRRYDPFAVSRDPSRPDFAIRELVLDRQVDLNRLGQRRTLHQIVDAQMQALAESTEAQSLDIYQERACRLLTSPAVRKAFDLSAEPAGVRERFGKNRFGQSCLLARRLIEAGVKLVTVFSAEGGKTPQDAWDTHVDNFRGHRRLLPPFDRGVATLLDDLAQRGLADRTLLVCMGEFGRTPRINAKAGRDHWADSYSILLAGGGIRPGQVYGQSDRNGAFAKNGRVFTPGDICATIYHSLGIDHQAKVVDSFGRPHRITQGEPMTELM